MVTESQNFPLLSRLRMISHDLQIDLGRRKGVKTEERLCVCGQIENEKHFLTNCHLYTHIRSKYDVKEDDEVNELLNADFTCDYVQDLYACRKLYV